MPREPETEVMDAADVVAAYAAADFVDVNRFFIEQVLTAARSLPNADALRVVDLGCGPGDITSLLAQQRPGWTFTAVDLSPAMLETARRRFEQDGVADRVALLQADVTRTDLPGGSFDVVLSGSVLHHVSDPLAFWREIGRLARSGGVVHVCDLQRSDSEDDARRLVATHAGGEPAILQREFFNSLRAAYTVAEVAEQLRAAGLATARVVDRGDHHLDVAATIE
ncbi:MAG: class I SAM-dependent methyltransferase [Planctomycetia bacterium]